MTIKQYFSNCNNIGKLVLMIGVLIAAPLAVLPFYPNEAHYAPAFLIPSLASIILGLVLGLMLKHDESSLQWRRTMQYSSLTVLFAWCYGFFAGSLPFVISGQLTFIQALFEAVSGWTTTGLSVMDVTVTPNIFLFHRSFMQFCGGLGFVMVMVMFIQGKQSMNLYNAEGHPDKLMPNLKRTAQIILVMYLSYLFGGTLLYILMGMNPFESLLHTMSALSTGGFSTRTDSIGAYGSLGVEIVTIVLMLIGTTNFAVLMLITRMKFSQVQRVSEIRFMFVLLALLIPTTAFALFSRLYMSASESIRIAIFNVVSALSTTGYSNVSYSDWPPFSIGIFILIMLIGGGLGSTAGGIKLNRIYLLLRVTGENIRKRLNPARNVTVHSYYKAQGKALIDSDTVADTMGFISCYLVIYIVGTLLMTLTANVTLTEAMFEFASTLGTVGLSIGLTGPETGAATLIVQMVGMVLGRLEIFIVLIGIHSGISVLKQRLQSNIK
ncbi:TrkH family potassium uptake protein [Cellulosilyticum sp. I15G10I2]|uniref:TrkH family potassium uptake protein n=1 Tax=Cellulosilyticum sp. I15G10I2 TaxID=1892843 RepID=UPI00085BE7D0|nr:TrkH family potassium uptake protein [Cellulosilyticum sp. I15G10I2]